MAGVDRAQEPQREGDWLRRKDMDDAPMVLLAGIRDAE